MRINVWKSSSAAAARAAVRRSTRVSSFVTTQHPLWTASTVRHVQARAIPMQIGRVQLLTTSVNGDDGPTIWQLADELRDAERIAKGDREPTVAAIQGVVIKPGSTDDRERQALDIIQSSVLESLLGFLADERLVDFHVPTYLSLIKLTSEPFIAQEILRLNGTDVIAKYLTNPDPRLQAAACLTIGNLALGAGSQATASSAEVIEGLFHVLSSPHEAIQRTAAATIANVAGSSVGRQQLCEIDHVVALCNLLSGEHSDSLRSEVAFALGNILSDNDTAAQDALRESGALPELILLVSPAYPDEICSTAAWAIHHGVHLNHESQSMVAEAGGLGMLFQHVFADNETLQTNALLALESTITGHEANLQSVRENTGAVELLEALKSESEDDLNPNAKRALNALLQQIL